MKATGIVRRIDELGRVVIPKEIRRTLHIRESDPLEIFTDREGQIILKKYSPIGELSAFAKQYAESLAQTLGCLVCICDMDQVIAASGVGKKELQGKELSIQYQKAVEARSSIMAQMGEQKSVNVLSGQQEEYLGEVIHPIICEGDVVGSVMLLTKEPKRKFADTEFKMVSCAASCLGKQMEQ